MLSRSSFTKVVSYIFLNLFQVDLYQLSNNITNFCISIHCQVENLTCISLMEVFKIRGTVSLQLLYTCLAADIFKPSVFVGKCRQLMLQLMGIFNHFLQYLVKTASSIFYFTHISVRSWIENDHRNFEKRNLCTINILLFGCKRRTSISLTYF